MRSAAAPCTSRITRNCGASEYEIHYCTISSLWCHITHARAFCAKKYHITPLGLPLFVGLNHTLFTMWTTFLCMLLLTASTCARTIPSNALLSASRHSLADDEPHTVSNSGSSGPISAQQNHSHAAADHNDRNPHDSHGDKSVHALLRQSLDIMEELEDELQRLGGKKSRRGGDSATRDRRLIAITATSCALEVRSFFVEHRSRKSCDLCVSRIFYGYIHSDSNH